MSEQSKGNDPGSVWRNQPEEKVRVNMEQVVNRRAKELYSSSRLEILMSIGAALFLLGVVAWRIPPAREGRLEIGFAAVVAWVAISLFCFRRRIWRREPAPPDMIAAASLDYYRRELERRRDHLRNPWLWYGPLSLACLLLLGVLTGQTYSGYQPLRNALPLVILLAVWTGFGFWRRHLQARELQREIDEIETGGPAARL